MENMFKDYEKASEEARKSTKENGLNELKIYLKEIWNAYIKVKEENKELVEYMKFYDDNEKDEQLGKLLENYQEISENKKECIKNYITLQSAPGKEIFLLLRIEKKSLKKNEKLCATAKNELDAYIKTVKEKKELAEYDEFFDGNRTDKQLEKLLNKYQETWEAKEKCYSQSKPTPDFNKDSLKEKEELCVKAKNELDVYIKMMKEKELDEYWAFYNDNGEDELLCKLLKKYQETLKAKEKCIKNCIQEKLVPDFNKESLKEKEELCAIAKNELDAYIKLMEEKKELVEYVKFSDGNRKDKHLGKLLKKYQETWKAKEKCIMNHLQSKATPDFNKESLKENEKLYVTAKNELDAYIMKMEDEKEKPKHSLQLLKDEESKQKMNEDLEKPKHSLQPLKKGNFPLALE
ncbi:hypothetical protein niasHT_034530 [Heterodera trifolii]|uniref:Uncharacterized protein n=1 Tax=Heterodera trifolii TaxID=157864 RepID=A0ABD2I573_9BILA